MYKKIITKFRVANEEGVAELLYLTRTLAMEKFESLLPAETLENYISANFQEKILVEEMNSLSNQWLVVFADDEPAGYVRITAKGKRPETITAKRAVRIADFGILKAYHTDAVCQSLFDKCISVGKGYEALWLNEYTENPLLEFFEKKGFIKQQETAALDELPVAGLYFIKEA